MAFEILNNALVTPPRLHAMIRLVSTVSEPPRPMIPEPTRADLFNLLQPTDALPKLSNQEAALGVFTAARHCGLLSEDANDVVKLQVPKDSVESLAAFRRHMQRAILCVTDDTADNYLLNIYSAWYAVQDDRVFKFESKDFEVRFNDELFPDSEARQFNTTKMRGWRV